MKRQIRFGVFETNSSSVHSLTIVSESQFEKFKNDELRMSWRGNLIDSTSTEFESEDTQGYDDFGGDDYEYFEKHHTTDSGEKIVAFGYHGYNG